MSNHFSIWRPTQGIVRRARPLVMTIALAIVALSASTAWAGDQARHDLFKRIQEQVLRYAFFTVFDNIDVEIGEDGFVTLSGRVTGAHKQRALEQRVAALDGVTSVINEITVLPASRFDYQLRYRVARAIYGDSTFWHYAARAHPSIHIVVERGPCDADRRRRQRNGPSSRTRARQTVRRVLCHERAQAPGRGHGGPREALRSDDGAPSVCRARARPDSGRGGRTCFRKTKHSASRDSLEIR